MLHGLALAVGLAAASGVGLAELPPAELSRGSGVAASSTDIPVTGAFRLTGVQQGVRTYEIALPVRPRVMFLSSMPPGMEVRRNGKKLGFALGDDRGQTWSYSAHGLKVRVAKGDPRPTPEEFMVRWPDAERRQTILDGAGDDAGLKGARSSLQVDTTTRTGLLLPAPARIAWQVDIPAGAVLRFSAAIVPPEVARGAVSDGATLTVRAGDRIAGTFRLHPGRFEPYEVSLAAEGDTTSRLEFRVDDADPHADYAFVAEPRVVVPTAAPKRVVMAFIDTLRRDHLGTYGYERAPAPKLDKLAANGVVFEDARSVAPWTLPSARTVLSGMQPERWSSTLRLQQALGARGWATGAFVGNIYLTGNFDMAQGWGEHVAQNLPYADYEVERGIDFLQRHPDEDALLLVHFMDLHLPYKELWPYRSRYAKQDLPGLGSGFARTALMQYSKGKGKRDQVRTYLADRYDQNLAAVDDAIARLLTVAGPDALVVVFSDHGEEFFDHGDLEHGHTLYDELLRVPLIVSGGGLAPRRVPEPVSLLDVTPTVLDLLGLGGADFDGFSLAGLARGEPDDRFVDRSLAFGRLLYGANAWGSLQNGEKWVSRAGGERVFDLQADPTEQQGRDRGDFAAGRAALERALDVPVHTVFRVTPVGSRGKGAVSLRVPGGVEAWWLGDEPTNHADAEVEVAEETAEDGSVTAVVEIRFSTNGAAQREVYVLPKLPPLQAVQGAALFIDKGATQPLIVREPGLGSTPLAKVSRSGRSYVASWALVPPPFGDELSGFDAESAAALQAIGYLDEDRGAGADEEPR